MLEGLCSHACSGHADVGTDGDFVDEGAYTNEEDENLSDEDANASDDEDFIDDDAETNDEHEYMSDEDEFWSSESRSKR